MENKVVVITGASSGIGKACALRFAKAGAKVVISARNKEKLRQVEKEIRSKGGEVLSISADVSVELDCKFLIDHSVAHFGGIDVLINNAGISMRALFADTDLQVIKNLMQVNFWGMVYCTKYALPHLLKTKGSVLGISSIAGYIGLPARTGYSASKSAMQGFLNALRSETRSNGLHVMIACPGFTASNIRKLALKADGTTQGESPLEEGKMMPAEEVAEHIYKGVISRKKEIVLTREGKLSVFMNKWFPNFVEKKVYEKMLKEQDTPLK